MTQNLYRFIISLMASCLLLPAFTQEVVWYQPGHEWFYKSWCSGAGGPGPCGYAHYTVESDEVIGGYDASTLLGSVFDESGNLINSNTHYFRTSGDSIFHYYEPSEIWYLLYSFNTPVGESWVVQDDVYVGYGEEDDLENWPFIVVVDSIDTVEIGGLSRKIVYTSPLTDDEVFFTSMWYFSEGIIEGIGAVGWSMFGDPSFHFGFPGSFSCFLENEEIIYGPFGYPCLPVGTENGALNNLEIFPNPATDRFSISLPENAPAHVEVRMYDLSGRLVHAEMNYKAGQMINLSDFTPGLYILQVRSGEGLYSGKLAVE